MTSIIFAMFVLSSPVHAADALTPVNLRGVYEFTFGGISIGRMGIEAEQNAAHYAVAADVMTTGLLKVFVKHSSHTTVDASGADFSYPDREYETHYQTKKKPKEVRMTYKDGKIVKEEALPVDTDRPAVPENVKNHAADPLTFLLRMRQSLHEAMGQKKNAFTLNVYDGRRLTEVNFTLKGKKTITYGNRPLPTIVLAVRRRLVAGFTESELKKHDPDEPTLYVYVTDDARLIPVVLETTVMFTRMAAVLAKECRTGESCLLGIKQ